MNMKILMIIPVLILVGAIVVLFYHKAVTGEFVSKDVELTGGLTIMADTTQPVNIENLERDLPNMFIRVAGSGGKNTIIVQTQNTTEEMKNHIINKLKKYGIDEKTITVAKTEPVLGDIFWKQTKIAIALAFFFMGFVVFFLFRNAAPSMAVMLAAFSDIVSTIAVMDLIGIRLSLSTTAALLMLIGYSIDTDILLTTRVLKRGGEFKENFVSALRTGLTMSSTSLAALLSIYLFSGNFVLQQISSVLIIGLLIDLPNTWIQNAGILKFWIERRRK